MCIIISFLYNKNKAKDNRNKAKLYDSIINSTLTTQDTIQPPTDTIQTPTDQTLTQSLTLDTKYIFCISCNKSYNKYYFSKHLTSKKHINNYTS